MSPPDSKPPRKELSYEDAVQQLETIVQQLEEGQLGLTQSLDKYEQGIKLLKQCYAALRDAEKRIELLVAVDPDGNATFEPFDHEASSMDQSGSRAERRGVRRKTAGEEPDVDDKATLF